MKNDPIGTSPEKLRSTLRTCKADLATMMSKGNTDKALLTGLKSRIEHLRSKIAEQEGPARRKK